MRLRSGISALVLLGAWLGVSTPAFGAPPPKPPAPLSQSLAGMARAEYEAAKILYEDGDYAGASFKFQRAYEESKDPRLLWNQAAAEKNLRHYVEVDRLVTRYLAESGDQLTGRDRADAQALLDAVKGFIGEVVIQVAPPGATIRIDDQELGVSPLPGPVKLEMGERKLRVEKSGFQTYEAMQTIAGGAHTHVDVTLLAEVHEGRLRVVASPGDAISVDGKIVGFGQWEGRLPSGIHNVDVRAKGKRPYQSDVGVQDGQLGTVRIALEAEAAAPASSGGAVWPWIVGGGVLLAGLGVGALFLFQPEDEKAPPLVQGTLDPGSVPLGGRF